MSAQCFKFVQIVDEYDTCVCVFVHACAWKAAWRIRDNNSYRPIPASWGINTITSALIIAVCLFVCQQDYTKRSQAIFVKPCRIMGYCCGKNQLNFGSIRFNMAEWQPFSTFYNGGAIRRIRWKQIIFHPHSADGAFVLRIVRICLAEVCGLLTASSFICGW